MGRSLMRTATALVAFLFICIVALCAMPSIAHAEVKEGSVIVQQDAQGSTEGEEGNKDKLKGEDGSDDIQLTEGESTSSDNKDDGSVKAEADDEVTIEAQKRDELVKSPEVTASEDTKTEGSSDDDETMAEPSETMQTQAAATRPSASISYQAHVQNVGWMNPVTNGQTAGTSGKSLRVEALRFTITGDVKGAVQCQAHVQNVGWQGLTSNPGTTGRSLRVEAIRLMLTGDVSQWYDITYRVHVQNKGWMSWVSNGAIAGTSGQSLRIEAIEAKLSAKSSQTAASDGIVGVRAASHVQNVGWQNQVVSGETTGTTGRGLRVEAVQLFLDAGMIGGGIQYKAHVQNKGWMGWVANGATSGTTGQALRVEAFQIHLTGNIANLYDVVYRTHVQNVGWQPWTLNDGIAGTTGKSLRVEALQVKLVKKNTAQDIAEGAYFIATAKNPQEVLYVTGNSESANTRMQVDAYATNTFADRFYVRKSNGALTLQAATSGLFLTDSGNSTVTQTAQNNADSQRWRFSWNGGYQLVNVATGKAMALASAAANGVWTNTAAANASSVLQRWTFNNTGIVPDGAYIFTNTNSGRVLDVSGANRRDGANVMIHDSNGGNNQKFTVTYLGSNQYSIRNVATQRAVQVSGTNVQMQGWVNSAAQKWRADLIGAKTFRFLNVSSGKAMDVAGNSKANSSNVVVASGAANSQRFKLTATSRVAEVVSIGVPAILQNPELPTGCESVALTEALNYYGFNLAKTTIADNYMPWSGSDFVYAFLGNPHTSYGAAIMAPGITNTANSFLSSRGSGLRASNVTGTSLGDLYSYLDQGIPVVVWNTMYMHDPGYVQDVQHGYAMRSWTHAVTLSGYNPFNNTVLVADPLSGGVWRDRGRFEYLYNEMGRQAVVIK